MDIAGFGVRADTQDGRTSMALIEGAALSMGSDRFCPEERPVGRVPVDSVRIDEAPVTNRGFVHFVDVTGYRIFAEIAPGPRDYPGMPPDLAYPGSLVFQKARGPIGMRDFIQWWTFQFGADRRHPRNAENPTSHIEFSCVVRESGAAARGRA